MWCIDGFYSFVYSFISFLFVHLGYFKELLCSFDNFKLSYLIHKVDGLFHQYCFASDIFYTISVWYYYPASDIDPAIPSKGDGVLSYRRRTEIRRMYIIPVVPPSSGVRIQSTSVKKNLKALKIKGEKQTRF